VGEITHADFLRPWGIGPKYAAIVRRTLPGRRGNDEEDVMSNEDGSSESRTSADLIEEGAAFMKLEDLAKAGAPPARERFDVIVIGGGQAGLAVGYHLARAGLRFLIVDGHARIGDSWRKRWDSLRLFTPAKFDAIVGLRFPAPPNYFPTKDEMGDYLEQYVAHFHLPVRTGFRVDRLFQRGGRYVVKAGDVELEADQVVVAMASYQRGKVPAFAAALPADVVQLHAGDYRNLAQLAPGGVLLAGAGNSGAEIALEIARGGHPTWVAGRATGEIPFRIGGLLGRLLLARLVLRFVFHRLLTLRTPLGRKVRPVIRAHGGPLIRTRQRDLAAVGVERVGRVAGVRDGRPVLEDGRALDVKNVVWCTGFQPCFDWIDLPIFAQDGDPAHEGGVVPRAPGLYFVGLTFLYAMSSSMIHGVSRDAGRIVAEVRRHATLVRPVTRPAAVTAKAFESRA
jgi:putative flavoprotein involved in K+ transport